MFKKQINLLSIWFFKNLFKYKDISHFVSSRAGGFSSLPYDSLNLGFHVDDNHEKVLKNRKLLATTLKFPLDILTTAEQVHGNNVSIITEKQKGNGSTNYESSIKTTDGMVTNDPNICLMVLLADCVPILFFDPVKKVIGVAHAGWRSTLKLIAQNTLKTLKEKFNSRLADIIVGIGPSIGPCCYEVGPEVIEQVISVFYTKEGYITRESSSGKGYFNLWEANKKQIMELGVLEEHIEIAEICTHCNHNIFFSTRRQQVKTGRFGAGIILKK